MSMTRKEIFNLIIGLIALVLGLIRIIICNTRHDTIAGIMLLIIGAGNIFFLVLEHKDNIISSKDKENNKY